MFDVTWHDIKEMRCINVDSPIYYDLTAFYEGPFLICRKTYIQELISPLKQRSTTLFSPAISISYLRRLFFSSLTDTQTE